MEESEARQKLMNYAYFYLNIRPRTVKEVRDYLAKKAKKFHIDTPGVEQSVIERLLELKLLNDQEFVRWYIEGKYASSKKSVFLLKQELSRVGISKDFIDEYFAGRQVDDTSAARDALTQKWRRISLIPDKKQRFSKAASLLARKGFSYDIIKKTIAELEGEE